MDKQQVISLIESKMHEGIISREDLLKVAGGSSVSSVPLLTSNKEHSGVGIINILYGIGAIIALVGVVILVGQHWEEIGFAGRVLVTLGLSFVTYIAAFFLTNQRQISQVMFTLSGALAPVGVSVMLNESSIVITPLIMFYIGFALALVYFTAWWATRRNVLVLFVTGFLTWAYYALIIHFLGNSYSLYDSDIFKIATMILGITYLFVAYGFEHMMVGDKDGSPRERKSITGILYGFGSLAILSAGISFGGWFNFAFIAVLFGMFYGSVFLKSRAMLVFSSLFLMGHIGKITSEYFADSIGWPLALIITGFLIIGVGYMTFGLNKKYLSTSA